MSKIKVAELFYSTQGEGRYMGVPSIFLRTFGCNFRCRGFGRCKPDIPENETHNPEVVQVIKNIDQYKKYEDLPLVSSGCDTYAAIYPEFKHLSPMIAVAELATSIVDLLPFKEWRDEHLVITGGEPLLGWQRAYPELLEQDCMRSLTELTFETNGTQPLHEEFRHYLLNVWQSRSRPEREVTFSVSPKLSVSGEKKEDAIKPEIICNYEQVGYTYLKFVVATEDDAAEALATVTEYRAAGFKGPIYLMPVGGVESVYSLNNKRVAEIALKHGLRYSDRMQVSLFQNAWGT